MDGDTMIKHLKQCVGYSLTKTQTEMENLEIKEEETFYGNRNGKWSKYDKNRTDRSNSTQNYNRYQNYREKPHNSYQKYSSYGKPKNIKGRNPLDEYGKITRCSLCESINHYKKDCPDRKFVEHGTFHQEYLEP